MDFEELINRGFQVSDALDPGRRASLASVAQGLDIALPRPSMPREEFTRVEASRQRALARALGSAWELVQPSSCNIQVLTVLMRLMVEVEGIEGILQDLRLTKELLGQCPFAESTLTAQVQDDERDKKNRQWSRYLDAVFAQIYDWLARHNEHQAPELLNGVAPHAGLLGQLLCDLDRLLSASKLGTGAWTRVHDLLGGLVEKAATDGAREGASKSNDIEGGIGIAMEVPADIPNSAGGFGDAPSLGCEPSEPVFARSTVTLQVSPQFWELQRSMMALGQLLQSGEFEKASIIATDLEDTLRSFSVTNYFPTLFAPFFELVARFADPLLLHRAGDSARASALMQLYRADLNRFLNIRLEGRA